MVGEKCHQPLVQQVPDDGTMSVLLNQNELYSLSSAIIICERED